MTAEPRDATPSGRRLGAGDVPASAVARAAVFAVLALLCAGAFVSTVVHLFGPDPLRRLAGLPVLVALAYALTWLALRELRHAAWLDGTVLSVRGPFRTRACDLATARYLSVRRAAIWSRHAGPVPVLAARKDDDGRSVRLPLVRTDGGALPHEERVLLADAIDAGVVTLDSRATARELRKPEFTNIGTPGH